MQLIKEVQEYRIGIVKSAFNHFITDRLLTGCLNQLQAHGVRLENIATFEVPGAIELPLVAKTLGVTRRYDAIIMLGCVIRGDTSHYDYVCQQVSYGCQNIALDLGLPIIFGVLTTDNEEQALARVGGQHGHKGADAADTALAMIAIMKKIQ